MAYGSSAYGRYVYGADGTDIEISGGGEVNAVWHISVSGGGSTSSFGNHSFIVSVSGGGATSYNYTHSRNASISGGGSVSTFYENIAAITDLACYVLSMDTQRTVEFTNYNFTGYGRFNQKLIGVKSAGIYDLETTATDDIGTDISSYFEIKTNFGAMNYVQLRRLFVDANVKVTLYDDSDNILQTINSLTADDMRGIARTVKGKWIKMKIENISGAQIEIKRIQGIVEHLGVKGV
jgi:hypothetical protein